MKRQEIVDMIRDDDPRSLQDLFNLSKEVKEENVGRSVRLRGIIEFSNVCQKDCFYCGLRKGNTVIDRYRMGHEEILKAAMEAYDMGYASILLQSGERSDAEFISFVEGIVRSIKRETAGEMGITLSLGEQRADTYRRWFDAGAHRYLLRIETSNESLYSKMHPGDHDFRSRLKCLGHLRDTGYQVGTGVLIGLPGQTCEDLADDIMFFRDRDIDMIGMGPYIVHEDTPLARVAARTGKDNFTLAIKIIALTRITLKDVNIASTTALQALDEEGRIKGLLAGANVVMPNITPVRYRENYHLYEGKPHEDGLDGQTLIGLEASLRGIGGDLLYREWGDSPHFFKRKALEKQFA